MRASDVEQIRRIWAEVAAIEETATSDGGHVEATVDARGGVLALRFDPRGYRRIDPATLAETTVATIGRAARLAHRRAFDAIAPLLADDATADDADLAFDPIMHHLTREA